MEPTDRGEWSTGRPARRGAGLGALLILGMATKVTRSVTQRRDGPGDDVPPPAAPPAARPPRRRRWLFALLAVVVVAAGAVGIATISDDDGTATATAPEQWDARLADLADFVARERGLEFRHPVRADFLSEKAFRKRVVSDEELTPEEADELDHLEGLFRALGLVDGDIDLRAATEQLSGEGIIGLYDPERDRISIRGDRVTAGMRPTIVHELTHALQAQHFDLEQTFDTSGESTAFRALVEADAVRIQRAYVDDLSDDEREEVARAEQEQADQADLDGVPRILTELFSLPYVLGPPFVATLESEGGDDAVDDAFRRPPSTEEHIIDPVSYLDGDRPAKVGTPRLADGEKAVGEPEDFGMLSMLLVLGERLPFPEAWAAVDGWKGDASIGYRDGGKDCIRIRTRLDDDADADELLDAARAWGEGRDTTVSRRGDDAVDISSCDPGSAGTGQDDSRPRTFELLQLRIALVSSLDDAGMDHDDAVCVADAVIREHDPRELLEVAVLQDFDDPRLVALQRDVEASRQRCLGDA